jgi:hypothetical protein
VIEQALDGYSGVQLSNNSWIADLEYADDIVLLAENYEDMQRVLDRLNEHAATVGLRINTSKTKFFSTSMDLPAQPLCVGGEPLEQVTTFKYLGSIILPNGQAKNEINHRIDCARLTFIQLSRVLWRRTDISVRTKMRVFNASVRPVLLYGCETWPLRAEDTRKLEVFDHWCLRYILKARRSDGLSNEEVRRRCFVTQRLSKLLQRRRLQWFGHVLRKTDTEICKRALAPAPCRGWRCRSGGQVKTWLNTVRHDMEKLGLQVIHGTRKWNQKWITICADLAEDRRSWAAAVRDIAEADSS